MLTCDALLNNIDYFHINHNIIISTISIDLKCTIDTITHDILEI